MKSEKCRCVRSTSCHIPPISTNEHTSGRTRHFKLAVAFHKCEVVGILIYMYCHTVQKQGV